MLDSFSRPQLALIHAIELEDELEPEQTQSGSIRSAQFGDIPGTRYHPDDGQWPRPYQFLPEPELSRLLDEYAEPAVAEFEDGLRADALNFQPFRRKASQDRYVVEQWDIDGKIWTMTAVFDGHLGDVVVEHAACHLPVIIRTGIEKAYAIYGAGNLSVRTVSQILHDGIVSFDQAIVNDVLALFPGGVHTLMSLSDEQIRAIINDPYGDYENNKKVQLCLHGTTALVALVDPSHENLWIANLGDCQAVLYRQDATTRAWSGEVLTNPLSGKNPFEVARVKAEHPGEPESVVDDRILGVIEPFRSIGDHPFKQPAIFTRRVLFNLEPSISGVHQWEKMLDRNISPPYMSSTPEVTHKRLRNPLRSRLSPDSDSGTKDTDEFVLLISTDGLSDLAEGRPGSYDPYRAHLDSMLDSNNELKKSLDDNLALCVLKNALGQDDEALSKALTLQMDSQWIDDVTIVVQML